MISVSFFGHSAFAEKNYDLTDNLRWAIDSSLRSTINATGDDHEVRAFLGLDIHKVFSRQNQDIGTLVVQPFLQKRHNVNPSRDNFDEGDDWDLTWRMTYFNYTGFKNSNALNIKIGHIEVPFGLEGEYDTNQTLRQFSFNERGLKADWGFSFNGYIDKYNYEFLFSRGSGNDLDSEGDPFLLSGRVGKQFNTVTNYGLSYYYGDVKTTDTRYKQIGFDLSYYLYQWGLLAEISGGQEGEEDIAYSLLETSWQSHNATRKVYWQLRHNIAQVSDDNRASSNSIFGYNWTPTTQFFVNSQLILRRHSTKQLDDNTSVNLQLRYRFQ